MEAVRQILDRVLSLSQSLGGLAAPLSGCLHIVKGALDLCLSLREQNKGIKALAANLPGVARVLGDLACTDGIHESDSLAEALKTLEEALNSCYKLLQEWERTGKVKKAVFVKSWELQLAGATGQVSFALELISASGVGLAQETRAEVMRMRKDLLCVVSGMEQLLSAACHNSQQLDVLVGQVARLQARSGGMSEEQVAALAAELRFTLPNDVERIMERHLTKRSPVARPPANGAASREDISEDERVAQLQNMGFSRLDAEDAVELHGGNLDAAADWILSGGPQRLAQGGALHTHATAWVGDAAVLGAGPQTHPALAQPGNRGWQDHGSIRDDTVAKLRNMGFPLLDAERAVERFGADLDTAVGWILSGGPQEAQGGESGAQAAGREQQPSDAEVTHDSGDSDGESVVSVEGALVAGGETGTWLRLEFGALSCDPGSDQMEQPYMRIFLLNGEGGYISRTPKRTPAAAERVDDGEWRLDHAVALNISLRSLSGMPGAVVLLEVMHLKQRRSKGQKESLRAWTFVRVQDVLRALLSGEEYEVQHGTMDLALYRKPSDPKLQRLHRMSTKKYANKLTLCVGVDGSS
ncbi:unnamed protein product [Pedinophyceae sp. YPF-701]|nr:unnamed protein product [Pedinophyceae sp. YPF-701]